MTLAEILSTQYAGFGRINWCSLHDTELTLLAIGDREALGLTYDAAIERENMPMAISAHFLAAAKGYGIFEDEPDLEDRMTRLAQQATAEELSAALVNTRPDQLSGIAVLGSLAALRQTQVFMTNPWRPDRQQFDTYGGVIKLARMAYRAGIKKPFIDGKENQT